MKNKFKKIIHIIQYIIIFILIFLIAYVAYQKFILKKTNISFFNHNFFIILSGSMEPTIKTQDLIVTSPKDSYSTGDIIAFNEGNHVTVHRIESVITDNNTTSYITKGDNNNAIDVGTLSHDNIIGAYKFTIPMLGSIFIFFFTNPIFLAIFVASLILIYAIVKLIRNRK
ncbi:MAG: signal peptidase I [Clostridia bacterium]|nr:signal peptidase I [Clostridia bacterium]